MPTATPKDEGLLGKILPDFDRETKGFFRWQIEYSRSELEEILRAKSGFDFGTLQEIVPSLSRSFRADLPVEDRRFEEEHHRGKGARNKALALQDASLQQCLRCDG